MTATLLEARQGIAEVLRTVDGLDNVYDYIHASPTPPCATVLFPQEWTPDIFIGGSTAWSALVPVQVLVALTDNESADRLLCGFLGASGGQSIVAAFDDPAHTDLFGRLDGYAVVRNVTDPGPVLGPDGGVVYLGALFNIEVQTT